MCTIAATATSAEAPIRIAQLGDGRFVIVANLNVGADTDVITSIWDPRTGPINGTGGVDVLTLLTKPTLTFADFVVV